MGVYVRLSYMRDADPHLFNLPAVLAHAFSSGELDWFEPLLMVMEGFSRPFTYMGYYQDVDREVDLSSMEKYGVELVRRWKLGYGNIFMDRVTGAWALAMPSPLYQEFFKNANEAFDILVGRVFLDTVRKLGVENSYYAPPNDIRVRIDESRSKKLCGTGVDIAGVGGDRSALYFNAFTNLRHPDPELPFKVLKIPREKIIEKGFTDPREYFASIEVDGGRPPKPGEFRDILVETVREVMGVEVVEAGLSKEEKIIWDRYKEMLTSSRFKIRRSTRLFKASMPPGTRYGYAQIKYRKLVQASVAVDSQGIIRAAMITGDFQLIPADADEEIVKAILGFKHSQYGEAADRVRRLVDERGITIIGASAEEFIKPVFVAAEKALEGGE
ncbi:lipoate--protein ligase family protein [Aeropyrum pernix]|uniref:lipoate--protein ligase family protein n=1 Tax=Aeropyrum pernix TaxID=56636 RepID=UPI001A93D88F|nr:biotin/lipoate A/B protein ligase family protein [Aeropyrum pernix]